MNILPRVNIWLKENWPVTLILLVALIVRLVYVSTNQAVWWDEAQHLLMGKHFVYGTPTSGWFEGRTPILALLDAFSFAVFGPIELPIRIIYVLIAAGIVLLTYLTAKSMFGKPVAFLAAGITAFYWEFFFNTFRLMSEIPALFFVMLSTYFLIIYFKQQEQQQEQKFLAKYRYLVLCAVSLAIAGLIKYDHLFFGIAFLIPLLLKKDVKGVVLLGLFGFLTFIPNMIYDFISYGSPLTSILTFAYPTNIANFTRTFTLQIYATGVLSAFKGIILLILFILGLIYLVLNLQKKYEQLLLSIVAINFIILMSTIVQDPRFFIRLIPFVAITISLGVISLGLNLAKLRNNAIAVVLVSLALIVFVSVSHLMFVIPILEDKATSYVELKEAGVWLKANTPSSEKIITNAEPYLSYYAERTSAPIGQNLSELIDSINNEGIRYILISAYELSSNTPEHIQKLPQLPFVSLVRSFNYGSQEPRAYIFEINKSMMQNFTGDANN